MTLLDLGMPYSIAGYVINYVYLCSTSQKEMLFDFDDLSIHKICEFRVISVILTQNKLFWHHII